MSFLQSSTVPTVRKEKKGTYMESDAVEGTAAVISHRIFYCKGKPARTLYAFTVLCPSLCDCCVLNVCVPWHLCVRIIFQMSCHDEWRTFEKCLNHGCGATMPCPPWKNTRRCYLWRRTSDLPRMGQGWHLTSASVVRNKCYLYTP